MLPTLHTQRLVLRQTMEEDRSTLFQQWSSPGVALFFFARHATCPERMDDLFDDLTIRQSPGLGLWILELKGDGGVIGSAGLFRPGARRGDGQAGEPAEMLVHIAPTHWGLGYATEALATLIEHAFGFLELDRLSAVVDTANARSLALFRRLGFRAGSDLSEQSIRVYTLNAHEIVMLHSPQ